MKGNMIQAMPVNSMPLADVHNFCVEYDTELFFYKNKPYIKLMEVIVE